MPKVQIATLDRATPVDPPAGSSGMIEAGACFGDDGDLHLHIYRLGVGAILMLDHAQIDRIAYVWQGAVAATGVTLPARSSVIVERGASVQLTASGNDAVILVFGAEHDTSRTGGHIHMLPSEHVPRTSKLEGIDGVGAALHSDATCATCQVWLHEMIYGVADYTIPVHSHSENEIIFVSEGDIRLGNRLYGTGTAIRIARDTKYGFRTGPQGMRFINFRGASPTFTEPGGAHQALDESSYWRDTLGAPQYVSVPT